jgi:hypothetical protein
MSWRNRLYHRLPRGLQGPALVRRRSRLWIERGIVYIHIPKAAGTSINQALFGRFVGHPRARDIERWGSQRLRAVPRFSVTRNPWDRLLSAYRFARRGTGIGEAVAGMRHPELYRIPEFDSFERFLFDWLAPRDINRLDPVFQPQCSFVLDSSGRLLVDHLGRVEDMGPTSAFVERTIGTIEAIPWTNMSGEPMDYREMYTPKMAALAGEIYRADVEAFGYEF